MAKNFKGKAVFTTGVTNKAIPDFDLISKEFARQVQEMFFKELLMLGRRLQYPMALIIVGAIEEEGVFKDLNSDGYSLGEFGLVVAEVRGFLGELTKYLANNIEIIPVPSPPKTGFISVQTTLSINVDYAEVTALNYGSYITQKNGYHIPWVEWLLTKGQEKVVERYRITYDPEIVDSGNSKSGKALMIKANKWWWSVPAEFAGNPKDNFLTRAIKSESLSNSKLSAMMAGLFKTVFEKMFLA